MNLKDEIVREIISISKKYQAIQKVVLFGSRARGDNSLKSDIDLAIYSDGDIRDFIYDIECNTNTLLEFDVSDMNSVTEPIFIDQIKKEGIIIYEKC